MRESGYSSTNQVVNTRARSIRSQALTAMSLLQVDEISDGFTTTVFPAARAPMAGFNNRLNGKFQGAMTDTTPYGSFQTWTTKGGGAVRGRTGAG